MNVTRRRSPLRTVVAMALVARWIRWLLVGIAVAAALAVHRRIPWIHPAYLGACSIALPAAGWLTWRHGVARRWRWTGSCLALLGFVGLWPVPRMNAQADNPPGTAWRLDGRLVIDGHIVVARQVVLATAGRPPVVAEVVRLGARRRTHDRRPTRRSAAERPSIVEPAAATIGLRRPAGRRRAGTVDAAIGGPFARTMPVAWYRNLSLGTSHGLMVALVSYVDGSGDDLAAGWAIAGTGGINGDGTVRPIGDLWAKATAAQQVGADVLLFRLPSARQPAEFEPDRCSWSPWRRSPRRSPPSPHRRRDVAGGDGTRARR